jgi:hypothetical protein
MTALSITCDNCGAKYKLPESFTGAQAKCQKCGSVIDVARQRAAATGTAGASPAAAAARPAAPAKPAAAARPAIDRSKEAPKPAERPAAAAARTERPARRAKADAGGVDGDDGGGRRGRERPAKQSSAMPLVLSGVGLLAIVVVVLVFVLGGGDKDKQTTTTAKTDAAPAKPAAAAPAAPDAAPKTPEPAKAAESAPAGGATGAVPSTTPDATEPAKPPAPAASAPADASANATPDDPTRVKRPWEKMRNPPATMADVADPKTYGEVQWPASIDDAKKAEMRGLAAEAAGDGKTAVRARNKLIAAGYPAMFGIVEQLQKLDYKDTTQSMVAVDLNKAMEEITGGLNARFEFVDATEEIPPAKAEWNTRSVKGWIDMLAGMQDEEKFKTERAARMKKQAGTDR